MRCSLAQSCLLRQGARFRNIGAQFRIEPWIGFRVHGLCSLAGRLLVCWEVYVRRPLFFRLRNYTYLGADQEMPLLSRPGGHSQTKILLAIERPMWEPCVNALYLSKQPPCTLELMHHRLEDKSESTVMQRYLYSNEQMQPLQAQLSGPAWGRVHAPGPEVKMITAGICIVLL